MGDRGSWLRGLAWILLAVTVWFVWSAFRGSISVTPADEAPQASELVLRRLDGSQTSLEELRGKVVLVNLWASWCGPCRREIPMLSDLYDRYRDDGLEILGVSVDEMTAAQIGEAAEAMGARYPVVLPGGPFQGTFEPGGIIPQSWIVDRAGRVRVSHTGVPGKSSLSRACVTLLAESES